jgi:uncharacterized protein YndB with AHSA1/START domain
MPALSSAQKQNESEREIVISRVFDAPRERVWNAWTDPKQVVKWWGPKRFTTTIEVMDVRPGGTWRHTMHGPDDLDYPNQSVFVEVVKPERIVYTHGGGRKGAPGAHFTATWTFEKVEGNKTRLTIHMLFDSTEARDLIVKEYGAIEGGKQTLGRLAELIEESPVVIERIFNAPAPTVWQAITDLHHMKQWYFPMLESFKPEVGFETSFNVSHGGNNFLHIWKVTEVVPGKKIAYSWKYGGYPGGSVVTFELFPEGNQTKLRLTHEGLENFAPDTHPELARPNFIQGWTHFSTALQNYVEKDTQSPAPEFVITRVFDASRQVVFQAFTEPEHLAHWWGPKGFTWVSSNLDLRPGGIFHYCMRSPQGDEMWGKFVYREITPPERLVFTSSFSDAQANTVRAPFSPHFPLEVLNTLTLVENQGKTTLTLRGTPLNASEEERQLFASWHPSMQKGFGATFDQLDEYLSVLRKEEA